MHFKFQKFLNNVIFVLDLFWYDQLIMYLLTFKVIGDFIIIINFKAVRCG